jgi:fructosamine-3-kinase
MRIGGLDLLDLRPVAGGDICRAFEARTTDGSRVFAKTLPDAPPGLFEAEARGLELLRVDGGPPVPAVRAVAADGLVLDWVERGQPSRSGAVDFGRSLAKLHQAGGATFGADDGGFVATVPLDNSPAADWPTFAVQRRLEPALREARGRHVISGSDAAAVDEVITRIADVAGPAEPPARVHGDLWAGNLLWSAEGDVWLVDAAAAHDGHRETDLAMLALFGAPMLGEIFTAYDEVYRRADGWESRVALHQIHPLLIHAVLFGGGYGARAGAAARATLSTRMTP